MFNKQTIADVDFDQKTVLIRVDYNVPIKDGQIIDDSRIKASQPTLELLAKTAKKIIILSHLGRPKGVDKSLSLEPIATRLSQILNQPVEFVSDWQAFDFESTDFKILLLENLRFDEREQTNDSTLVEQLVQRTKAELFVQDGFSICHRQSASTIAITKLLPSVASLNLKNQYQKVGQFLNQAERPVMAIVGGAKISDKIDFIKQLVKKVDYLVIGGAMANTFLLSEGYQIGRSLVEDDQLKVANRIKQLWLSQGKSNDRLVLPIDVKTTTDLQSNNVVIKTINSIEANDIIADIGPATTLEIAQLIDQAQAIIWNGNLGYTENPNFVQATETVVKKLISSPKQALIGGGDTVGFVNQYIDQNQNPELYLSTGGGAMLELIAYSQLPAVEALLDKD